MAAGRFLHVYISPKPSVTTEEVEAKMNKAVDWYRYAPNLYVVWSTGSEELWEQRLLPLCEPGGGYYLARLDPSEQIGYMPQEFWDWVKKRELKD